jgi:hypothetical protein
MSFTIVQIVHIDETGDSYYRMRWPAVHLVSQDSGLRLINVRASSKERIEYALEADLLVLYQSSDVDLLPIIERRKQLGRKTLVEYNDNFYAPAIASPVARAWTSPLIWQLYETFMNFSDGIIVTGPGLKKLFTEKTSREIFILENHLPEPPKPFDELYQTPGATINIGWAGSLGHVPDLLAAMPTIKSIINKYSNVVFHLMGNETLPHLLGLPKNKVMYTPWGSMQQYYNFWKPIHIGIAPLIDTPYNRCRSDIKAIEMAGNGVLPILKQILPYEEFINKTKTLSFANLQELEFKLEELIINPALIKAQALPAYEYVAKERVGTKHVERLELFKKFLPLKANNYNWNLETGYHEIIGTAEAKTQTTICFEKFNNLRKENKNEEAVLLVKEYAKTNRFNIDLQLLLLNLTALQNLDLTKNAIQELKVLYPKDLRINILEASIYAEKRIAIWQEIIKQLKTASENYRNFFAQEVQNKFLSILQQSPEYFEIALSLLDVYPKMAALRLAIAEMLIVKDKFDEAYNHFDWLSSTMDEFELNKKFFSEAQWNYIKAIKESLLVRKNKLI